MPQERRFVHHSQSSRYLSTLAEIGAEQNSTIVFPVPIDLVARFLGSVAGEKSAGKSENSEDPS